MGFSSRSDMPTLTVVSTPSQDLALTNHVYCSASDLRLFAASGSPHVYVLLSDSAVFNVKTHGSIASGNIALNAIQRRYMRVSAGDRISASRFDVPGGFNLAVLTLELEFVKTRANKTEQLDAALLSQQIHKRFDDQIVTAGQKASFEYCGTNYIFTVNQALVEGRDSAVERGLISSETYLIFEAAPNSGIKVVNQRESTSSKIFRQNEFNLQKLGIGGLGAEFNEIFRRAFASRVFPSNVTSKLGIKHVKGMLLHGPPGTGKTLIARQIGKLLNGREPKIVNGPEVLSKYVGETEKNVRDLFADAENEQKAQGDESELHVIIFDEIDAICKSRGSTRDGTGVHDSIVNQLLTKIDGVDALNNVLLIGMTNRKDMLDEALLRPGRLEVHMEIGLPDKDGRCQILQIHTNKMEENSYLCDDVNLDELADKTKNYSGAELEGVVRSAVSYALNRLISMDDLTKNLDLESIRVTRDDFMNGLQEIVPAFGASTDNLERYRLHGIVDCGPRHSDIFETTMLLVEQVKVDEVTPLVSCLLEGPRGSGKSAMAATIAINSGFPYVKIVSAESMPGRSEANKCQQIIKVFEDAYKSEQSIVILDNIERLLEYSPIGPRFSNQILQTLLVHLDKLPPKGKKLLIMGTTSEPDFLESSGIWNSFSVKHHVPSLNKEDAKKVLQGLNVFAEEDMDVAAEAANNMPIKTLYMAVNMAAQGAKGGSSEAIYAGREKIDINYYFKCVGNIASI